MLVRPGSASLPDLESPESTPRMGTTPRPHGGSLAGPSVLYRATAEYGLAMSLGGLVFPIEPTDTAVILARSAYCCSSLRAPPVSALSFLEWRHGPEKRTSEGLAEYNRFPAP